LWAILTINFFIIQCVPGGPVEQLLAKLEGHGQQGVLNNTGDIVVGQGETRSKLPQHIIDEINKMYGFDKPLWQRYLITLKNYAQFDLGVSFSRHIKVTDLIIEKMPVSASLGIWTTILMYLISIPLGIRKAVRHGARFDIWSSTFLVVGNVIPPFLLGLGLIIIFSGGNFLDWFPMRGLTSDNFHEMSFWLQVQDYVWHLTLPILSILVSSLAGIAFLTKNSFLEEMHKQYVMTAKAKGLKEKQILYGHIFRNAMLIIIAMLPGAILMMFFSGSLIIEIIFSLDGLGLLSYQATLQRDFPVVLGTLYLFTLLGLFARILGDFMYVIVDKRINFHSQEHES
tara:strand:- start:409 stop:1431 length:1023 start_codon:yes stop_codon:yes gene_type:complete